MLLRSRSLNATVSAGPRAWPASIDRTRNAEENMDIMHSRNSHSHTRNGTENCEDGMKSPVIRSRASQETSHIDSAKDGDKKKKWSLGGFFRRKKKEVESDSSSADDEHRKSFLSRRRSRREKRKSRSNKTVGTFDHVVVNPLTQPKYMDEETRKINSPVEKDIKLSIPTLPHSPGGRSRGSKDSLSGSVDRMSSKSSHDSSTQRFIRRDSSLTRNSSGGSGSIEGSSLRGKRAVKARVEAARDSQRGDSSSEEGDCFVNSHAFNVPRIKSDDSIMMLQREGSFNKKSRSARTERYIKRMSRDEDVTLRKEPDTEYLKRQRLCKSDVEGSFGRTRSSKRWAVAAYQDSSDHDLRHFSRKSSASPSPAQSPLVKPRNSLHYTASAPATNTYNASNIVYPVQMTGSLDRKIHSSNLRVPMPSPSASPQNYFVTSSKSSESVSVKPSAGFPKCSVSSLNSDHSKSNQHNYNTTLEIQNANQRSLSYDSNIHRTASLTSSPSYVMENNDVMVVQFPVARLSSFQARKLETTPPISSLSPSCFVAIKQAPPPPPPRDPQRRILQTPQVDSQRPMSYAFENKGSVDVSQQMHYQESAASNSFEQASPLTSHQLQSVGNKENYLNHATSYEPDKQNNRLTKLAQGTHDSINHRNILSPPRPSSVTPESMKSFYSHQITQPQEQSGQKRFISRSHETYNSKPHMPTSPPLQYFADQNPRSRRPIHIQCNNNVHRDQPYLSDSQVVMKPPCQDRRHPSIINATEFWKQKEQESAIRQRKLAASPKPPLQPSRGDRSRSNSPRLKDSPESLKSKSSKIRIPISFPVRQAESQSSISGQSDISSSFTTPNSRFHSDLSSCDSHGSSSSLPNSDSLRRKEINASNRPLSMVLENAEIHEQSSQPETCRKNISSITENLPQKRDPPTPPTRRYSRQSSASSIEANGWMHEDGIEDEPNKRRSSNLEEALTELEAIYNSLRLGDEDLLDRAERRDLPTLHQKRVDSSDNLTQYSHSWGSSRGAESDSGFNYNWASSSIESLHGSESSVKRKRAPPLRRSGIPDKITDDMAYRRLHPKERPGSQDVRNVVSQTGSYILASPALNNNSGSESSLPGPEHKSLYAPLNAEPDVTFDDVVYRSIRHANNTLKVLDPQPPFGIPLGPIACAASSDYLHAQPLDNYKPTFKPRKNPDVVKDDLAYRNLRKDNQKEPILFPMDDINNLLNSNTNKKSDSNFSMRRKRAVRSLSANLQNIICKEPLTLPLSSNDQGFEKAQSFSDLPDALQVAQKILEGKDVIGGGAVKLRNLTSRKHAALDSSESGSQNRRATSWVERASLGERASLFGGTNTSTETLTDSRANLAQDNLTKRNSWQQKLRVSIPPPVSASESGTTTPTQRQPPPLTPERKFFHNPAEFARYSGHRSAASSTAPSPTSNTSPINDTLPVPQSVPGSPLDEGQLEELLSALAREARATSEKLGRELKELTQETTNLSLLKASTLSEEKVPNVEAAGIESSATDIDKIEVLENGGIPGQSSFIRKNNAESITEKDLNDGIYIEKPVPKDIEEDRNMKVSAECDDCNKGELDSEKHINEQLLIQHTQQQLQKALKQIEERQQQLQTLSSIKTPVDEVVRAIKDKILLDKTNQNSPDTSPCDQQNVETEHATKQNAPISLREENATTELPKKPPSTEDDISKTVHEEDADVSQPSRCDEGSGGPGWYRSGRDDAAAPASLDEYGRCPFRADMSERRVALTLRTSVDGSPTSCSSDGDGGVGNDAQRQRADRIAQYKEERRRQLASQFGTTREENAAPKRYITRSGNNTSAGSSGGSSGGNVESASGVSRIRTTRASRLRAAAVSPSESAPSIRDLKTHPTPSPRISPQQKPSLRESSSSSTSQQQAKEAVTSSRLLSGASRRIEPMVRRKSSSNTLGTTSSEKEKSPALSQETNNMTVVTKKEKDKSSKRKSNLNRSLTEEEVVSSDIIEDSAVRRRRRRVELMPELQESLPCSGEAVSTSNAQSLKSSLRVTAETGQNFLQSKRAQTAKDKSFSALLDGLRGNRSSPEKRPSKEKSSETFTPTGKNNSIGVYKDVGKKGNSIVENGLVNGRHYQSKKSTASVTLSGNKDRKNVLGSSDGETKLTGDKLLPRSRKTGAHCEHITANQETRDSPSMTKKSHEHKTEESTEGSRSADKLDPVIFENDPSPSPERRLSSLPIAFQEYIQSSHNFGEPLSQRGPLETSRSCSGSPVKRPSSILKKKSLDESCSLSQLSVGHPVSILKRKTSQDEAGPSHPVTFSPSVIDHSSRRGKRPGILKKRASLDESEVMRRRSCSPDLSGLGSADFRPILKNQRRSSMEELSRRTQSPDPQPQSILKRRTSREDELEERNVESPEPHGILKRKSASSASNSSSSSSSPHVSISATVLMNVGFDATDLLDNSDQVKPILKKKSSSEDTNAPDLSSLEPPKPILKKKQSIEIEDLDEKPKKPILKSSRKLSQEENVNTAAGKEIERGILNRKKSLGSDSISGSDCDTVKPILKQTISDSKPRDRSLSPRHRLSFSDTTDVVNPDSSVTVIGPNWKNDAGGRRRRDRPASVCGIEKSTSPVTDSELLNILHKRRSWEMYNSNSESEKQQCPSQNPELPEENQNSHTLSVAERILNMENTIQQELPASTGAVPKSTRSLRSTRSKERFFTQPITIEEIKASKRSESFQAFQRGLFPKISSDTDSLQISLGNEQDTTISFDSLNSPLESKIPPETSTLPSQAESIPPVTRVNPSPTSGDMEGRDSEETVRNTSVTAKAALFAELEEQLKKAAEEAKAKTKIARRDVSRYRDRREDRNRFSTQPITMDEFQEAVRQNERVTSASTEVLSDSKAEDESKEDDHDPSKLSLAERVKLFNQKISEEQSQKTPNAPLQRPVVRKRLASRFKTQPVTTEEVDSAQRMSPLAASLVKPPDPSLLASLSAKAVKEKIYEHASNLLAKSGSTSRIPTSDVKPKGILKSTKDINNGKVSREENVVPKESFTPPERENDFSKEISKTPELESFQHLKSVLKKESVTSLDEVDRSISLYDSLNPIQNSLDKHNSNNHSVSESSSEEDSNTVDKSPGKQSLNRHSKDLVSILHDVEALARHQREKNNKVNSCNEIVMNQRNLNQEKENLSNRHSSKSKVDNNVNLEQCYNPQNSDKILRRERNVQTKYNSDDSKMVKKLVESPHGVKVVTSKRIQQISEASSANETTPPTSDGETSSSGGREIRRIIGNNSNSHRRRPPSGKYHKNRSVPSHQQELAKSKSHSSVPISGVEKHVQGSSVHRKNVAKETISPYTENNGIDVSTCWLGPNSLQRSFTQPLANLEDKEVMSGASIAERLAALKKRGEIDWRKRVPKLNPDDELNILNELNSRHDGDKETKPLEFEGGNSRILADRLGKLDAAAQGWKKRVEPTDAIKFSVAGKMKLENKIERAASPLHNITSSEKKKRTPPATRFRSKGVNHQQVSSSPSSPQKEYVSPSFKRSISAPGGEDEAEQGENLGHSKVSIPRADDETFSTFFTGVNIEKLQQERIEVREEDFDELTHSSQLLVQKRGVKMQRRHVSSRNPLKALAARTDLREEYTEIRTGIAEKEMRRLNVEKLAKHSPLAVEALAGLASKEDFTAVALKKSTHSNMSMLPYKDLMLLHVKGRRHIQTRLVEPSVASVNRGDNYVLVTPTEVYNWVGKYSNVIEQARAAEVALHIQQKKDLGCTSASQVITICDDKFGAYNSQHAKKFWKLLGGDDKSKAVEAGHPDEDELYETSIINTNMIYEVQDEELVPLQEYWGGVPKIEMLNPSKILIFDFGSEMYVWNGKDAPLDRRRVAARLAQELWQEPYDYSDCDLCPINIAGILGDRGNMTDIVKSGNSRPSWGLLARITQHMETILFREKFLDWPDFSRVILAKGCDNFPKQSDNSIDIKPCDAESMLNGIESDPDLELEGSHLGRGDKYFDEEMRRCYDVKTLNVTVWHIQEFEYSELPGTSRGQFHTGDSYVVRWLYSVTVTGRELNGQPSRHAVIGRNRCAYFCWQGAKASLNEQGAAALLTVELDHERGPQVRVVEGQEPPAFLNLFQGSMVVHDGKREEENETHQDCHLYMCRGELAREAVLVEIPCSMRQLRSRASLIMVNRSTGGVTVWHGSKSLRHTRQVALSAAEYLKKKPLEMEFLPDVHIVIQEEYEGSESKHFLSGVGGNNRYLYTPLYNSLKQYTHSPRMYHLSSVSGTFSAVEVLCPYRCKDVTVPYPFLQSDLYGASQPALFLLDNEDELWLWQGWWPDPGDESCGDNSNVRGSHAVLWQAERRAAMQTALSYWQCKHGNVPPKAYLVWAGLEPLEFTNLFSMWVDRDDIAQLNISDGRKPGEVLTVGRELARLTCSTYSVAELMQRPLPDGVDPTRLEIYLDAQDFQDLLGLSKEEFSELPTWKQSNIKKEVGLF